MQITQFGTSLANAIDQHYGGDRYSAARYGYNITFGVIIVLNMALVAFLSVKLARMWAHTIWRKASSLLPKVQDQGVSSITKV